MKMKHLLLLVATLVAFSLSALASNVVDQYDYAANAYMAAFYQTDLAQSFTPSYNNSSGAGIYMYTRYGGTQGITISLWTNLPNNGGIELASASSGPISTDQWADVFWSPVAVTPGNTYYLVFDSVNNASGIWGDVYNGYAGGMVFANPGYQAFPNYDYTFREYANPTPEPGSLVLLGTGLVGLAGAIRRKISL